MRTVVFAYHNMGLRGLDALERAGYEIKAVISHEDDPRENCWFGSVKDWANKRQIPLHCPESVNNPDWFRTIATWAPDVIFSFYYRKILSKEILAIPPCGAFNLHGSLLPRYRGRCPVNWVLVNGETMTGVTLHRMNELADAGDIIAQRQISISFDDTAPSLYNKICDQASCLLDETLLKIKDGTISFHPQDAKSASYFGGRKPQDGRINWNWRALRIYNLIRAVTDPYPGAFTTRKNGETMIIWWGIPTEASSSNQAGQIILGGDESVTVSAGKGGGIRLLDIEINGQRLKNEGIWQYFSTGEKEILR